jgi:ABC-type transport system involved in cytochrome c biogenesis permease subunit
VVLAVVIVAGGLRPHASDDWDLASFASLPVVDQGRVKPMDTLARTSLLVLAKKQSIYTDGTQGTVDRKRRTEGMTREPAVRWLLDVMARPAIARGYEVVRVDHPDVLSVLGQTRDRKLFSVDELLENTDELNRQIKAARAVQGNDRTGFQRKIMELSRQLNLYFYLEDVASLLTIPEGEGSSEWTSMAEIRTASAHDHDHDHEGHDASVHDRDEARWLAQTVMAWRDGNSTEFNAAVGSLGAMVDEIKPDQMRKVRFEAFFNRFAPFLRSMTLYVLAFLLAVFSWLGWSRPLAKAALGVIVVALVVHTFGLWARIWIQGRPPVTNLYSSAIFTGWGAVVLGAAMERFYKNGVGSVAAAGTGFFTLVVAHNLALDGDTMTMMQAVLDTNFWLATHVVVITLGYAATFLAGMLGILFILRGVFTRAQTAAEEKSLARMIYGIVCFATLFSFVGTILGGIWADQSWGRFWGWDPKENGALLIVLWNALILHARWGGLARERGLACLAVGGNIVTSWSWFGTNMLGVGLHAYGFIDSAVFWMFVFVLSQLAIIGIGSMPRERWRSVAGRERRGPSTPEHSLG